MTYMLSMYTTIDVMPHTNTQSLIFGQCLWSLTSWTNKSWINATSSYVSIQAGLNNYLECHMSIAWQSWLDLWLGVDFIFVHRRYLWLCLFIIGHLIFCFVNLYFHWHVIFCFENLYFHWHVIFCFVNLYYWASNDLPLCLWYHVNFCLVIYCSNCIIHDIIIPET